MSTPTQIRRPRQAVARTAFAVIVALAAMLPSIVQASGLDETWPPVAGVIAIATAITRVMALPVVDDFLARFLPWFAADPPARRTLGLLDDQVDQVGELAEDVQVVLVASVVCHVCSKERFELPITTTLWGFTDVDDMGCISVTVPGGNQAFNDHMNQHRVDGTFTDRLLAHADQLALTASRIREQRARE